MQCWQPFSSSVRTSALLATFAASVVLAADAAQAADKVYIVANYPIEAVAENAVAAKQKALAEGQQAAFLSLLKRLMPVTAYPRAKQFASVKAVELVEGIRVRSERNSATEYTATYDFYFRPRSVRDLLRREGIPFTDEQAPATTLIPVWQAGASTADQAAWVNNWKGLDLDNSLTPIKIESLRKDMRPDAIAAVAAGDVGAMRSLAAQYKTEHLLVAIAESEAATGRLAVTLAGRDAVGAFVLKRQYRVDPADPAYARELAAVVALRTLEGRWKTINARGAVVAAAPADTDLLIAVEFRGMAEWQEISRKLSATPGVEELDVAGLSARGARVTLRYAEGAGRLADELARQGLSLRSTGGNWVLSLR
jgi:hypothetical protein